MPSRCIIMPRTRRPRRWSPRSAAAAARRWRSPPILPTKPRSRRLLPDATAALGPIGVLVNNASIFENDTVATATRESWDAHLAVNLRAPFVLIQDFAALLPADSGGVVINLLDERVWNLTPYFVSYTVSKTGLWTLTRTMALALAPRIRVNAIGPGPTLPNPRQTPAAVSRSLPQYAAAARHQPPRDRGGDALHPRSAGDDRPDDRARWRRASRLGTARTRPDIGMSGTYCRLKRQKCLPATQISASPGVGLRLGLFHSRHRSCIAAVDLRDG